MAKRPLLTIQIPSLIDRVGKDERTHEVSCFSPFTPDGSSSGSLSATSSTGLGKTGDAQRDTVDDIDEQSISNVMEDEGDENSQPTTSRFGTRWSRRLQHGCLQSMFQQGQRTPTRRKRLSMITVSPFSAIELHPNRRTSPQPYNGHSNSRRTSNPFDYLSLHRHSKIAISPTNHDKTPTQLVIRPVVPVLVSSPLESLNCLKTPKNLNAPWSSTTC
ncbi:hypothetical protein PtB15_13B157 [Puccinia triticina]|nr:hypothetical protein PtB15_13B157 [Puccinia triticina]